MAFDAICVSALLKEFKKELIGAKTDKVYMPEKDEITLFLRTYEKNFRLVLSASASNARAHFSEHTKENPKTAPNFCMLLRKHLSGGRIIDIVQPDFERILDFHIEAYTELGEKCTKHLICEIMGRYSNIILTDESMKILDCIKHIDSSLSSQRRLLPGLSYSPPPKQDKICPLFASEEDIAEVLKKENIRADKRILDSFSGLSPIIVREVLARARVSEDTPNLNSYEQGKLKEELCRLFSDIRESRFEPCILKENGGDKMIDFCVFDVLQYGEAAKKITYGTVSEAVDDFYRLRDAKERQKQKSAALLKLVSNNTERCAKKLVILKKTLDDAENMDKYRISADLIRANIALAREGARFVEAIDYFDENMPTVRINLDPALSPQQNAEKYYKKYTKAKVAKTEAAKQFELAENELHYFESVRHSILLCESEAELTEIKRELADGGYIKKEKSKGAKPKKNVPSPLHFVSSDGFDIYCGKNNVQNDYITLRLANNSDIWFHIKDFPGSHTVIKLGTDKNIPDRTYLEAATIAATYSSVSNSGKIPIDYTEIKNVHKPSGAKPGMVIYDKYYTVYVTPDRELADKLKAKN